MPSYESIDSSTTGKRNFCVSMTFVTCACCAFMILMAVLLPIGIINSIPPKYCYSTEQLRSFPSGSVIMMEKQFGNSHFNIYNSSTKGDLLGVMKYRSWAIPYTIDLMTPEQFGSGEGRGSFFSLAQQVSLFTCQNDSEVPFINSGSISQQLTLILGDYKIYDEKGNIIADVQEELTLLNTSFYVKSPDGTMIYAHVETLPFASFLETWKITTRMEPAGFDWRRILYLISVVSYNKRSNNNR